VLTGKNCREREALIENSNIVTVHLFSDSALRSFLVLTMIRNLVMPVVIHPRGLVAIALPSVRSNGPSQVARVARAEADGIGRVVPMKLLRRVDLEEFMTADLQNSC
jgi:hypothetical protein